jgi:hypothetical protein
MEIIQTSGAFMNADNFRKSIKGLKNVAVIIALGSTWACQSEKKTAAPSASSSQVEIQFAGSETAQKKFFEFLIPTARAEVSNLTLCFKRLRFKLKHEDSIGSTDDNSPSHSGLDDSASNSQDDNSPGRSQGQDDSVDSPELEDSVDFSIGEVSLDSNGVFLGAVTLPKGTYQRIEFDLENNCGSGQSIELTNGYGSYKSSKKVTIRFEGEFVADDASEVLMLNTKELMDAANEYKGATSLAETFKNISGRL